MTTNRVRQRDELFSIYARNLSFYCPDAMDQFICPICLKIFNRTSLNKEDPEVILAHVIPKNMDGKLITLSCKICDNHIGTAFDAHMFEEKKFHDFEMGFAERPVDISYSGGKLPCYLKLNKDEESPSFSFWPVHPHEPRYPRFIQNMVNQWDGQKVNIEFSTGFAPIKRNISLLHSAFLMMFYRFGYEYIFSANAECVRQVINGSNTSWDLSKLVSSISFDKSLPIKLPTIGLLLEPKEISAFIVIIESSGKKKRLCGIALPGFGEKGYEAYRCLLKSPEHPIRFKILFPYNTSIKNPIFRTLDWRFLNLPFNYQKHF